MFLRKTLPKSVKVLAVSDKPIYIYIINQSLLNSNNMKMYTVTYSGANGRFKKLAMPVLAESEREAVIKAYRYYLEHRYFEQPDGRIFDADGECIAEAEDDVISYDGGYFQAEEIDQDE